MDFYGRSGMEGIGFLFIVIVALPIAEAITSWRRKKKIERRNKVALIPKVSSVPIVAPKNSTEWAKRIAQRLEKNNVNPL